MNRRTSAMGRILATLALITVVVAGALIAIPSIMNADAPEPPPSRGPTQEPTQQPSRSPSPTPDPTDTADGLISGPVEIEDEGDGFRLDLPDGWYTNAPGSSEDPYRWFGPEPFDPVTADTWTVPITISMQVGGSYGPGGKVISQKAVTVGGFSAVRMEIQGEAGGFIPPNALNTAYLVAVDGEPVRDQFPGRWLLAALHGQAGDYEANQLVLDQLLGTLEVLD
ncbi:MAG: hypothetical protein K5924_00295 [Chloroflexi bacterium]|nr:hypothetical protein [Chloroflexota bacterium]